jgi:phosphoglucosamine mutase
MRKLFGTDGIRGAVDVDLTPDLVTDVGRALAMACRNGVFGPASARPRFVVGRDTRSSGARFEAAITEGLTDAGADVFLGGVLPTAAVAYLTAATDADAGVVLSASHNPPPDNGIKVFAPGGWKLTIDAEREIEALIGAVVSADRGDVAEMPAALDAYVDHLVAGAGDLGGLRIVVDCAYGAAFRAAPDAFRRLGADVTAINATDDGDRINDGCGALHPDVVGAESRTRNAIGITLDGDADRVLCTDEEGNLVDGDAILAILAAHLRETDRLAGNGVVVTVMANQALRSWCASEGIDVVETAVGDRHVLESMRERNLVLGGEQSGHVIVADRATTGDGILTAIEVLEAVAAHGGRLAGVVPFRPMPQVLVNVRTNGGPVTEGDGLRAAIDEAQQRLAGDGRILVRRSGTEPVVRVMVEAPDHALASELAADIAAAVRRDVGEGA